MWDVIIILDKVAWGKRQSGLTFLMYVTSSKKKARTIILERTVSKGYCCSEVPNKRTFHLNQKSSKFSLNTINKRVSWNGLSSNSDKEKPGVIKYLYSGEISPLLDHWLSLFNLFGSLIVHTVFAYFLSLILNCLKMKIKDDCSRQQHLRKSAEATVYNYRLLASKHFRFKGVAASQSFFTRKRHFYVKNTDLIWILYFRLKCRSWYDKAELLTQRFVFGTFESLYSKACFW